MESCLVHHLLLKTEVHSCAEQARCRSRFFCALVAVVLSSISVCFDQHSGKCTCKTVLITKSGTLNTLWENIMGSVQDFSTGRKVSNTCQGINTSRCRKKLKGKDSVPRCLVQGCYIYIRDVSYISEMLYKKVSSEYTKTGISVELTVILILG